MKRRSRLWLWLLLPLLIIAGLMRLRFDVEVLNLLPPEIPAVQGLKNYQQHFANARELIVNVRAPDAEQAENATRWFAEKLRAKRDLAGDVTWQPPWNEHPEQTPELIAHLWFNQPPEIFAGLANRLAPHKIPGSLAAAREQLATSLSPGDIARLSYDPLGLTQLPDAVSGGAPGFGKGDEMFSSADGTFRMIFVKSATDLATYHECLEWFSEVKATVAAARAEHQISKDVLVNYTGRPAFVSEISGGMQKDIMISVGGTSLIIGLLFYLAHRRLKPMLWLLTLLAVILAGTLALGGLIFGTVSVVSMGFAAILLGLAVDYAVVHYQEALAHPDLYVPEIRRAIAPSIFWAAVTTITAFLVLNFGGLPGLAQLGTLVGVGVALSALIMIFAFLPPLFPDRRHLPGHVSAERGKLSLVGSLLPKPATLAVAAASPTRVRWVFVVTLILILFSVGCLLSGLPKMDSTADAMRPRRSEAHETLEMIKRELGQPREPLQLLVGGRDEAEVARRLGEVQTVLQRAVSNETLTGFTLPTALWPRPDYQSANRATARALVAERDVIRALVLTNGFTETSLGLTEGVLTTWKRAADTTGVFWPTNDLNRWILEKLVARGSTNLYALGLLYLPKDAGPAGAAVSGIAADLPRAEVWLTGWELLGHSIFASVKGNLWKLLLPMVFLVLLSLWLAFRRPAEILLSLGILTLSGLLLLAVMKLAGWQWNLLNLMALPLILGTGVDYSIFMQLALRRHHGDLEMAHRSVGRALLLCGATAFAGFGALIFSSNAGMASLGQVCAVGIAGNMLFSVFLLPVWWKKLAPAGADAHTSDAVLNGSNGALANGASSVTAPSSLYRSELWSFGMSLVRILPRRLCLLLGRVFVEFYWLLAGHRRQVVMNNLSPALHGDAAAARRKAKALFLQFAVKIVDLWRYEAGLPIAQAFGKATGDEHFNSAQSEKRGVLLLTPHLGNWEFGGPWLTQKGITLQVVTLIEPGRNFTQLRQAARARWNIETIVIGNDPFAFVTIIKRLEAGATVALLIDRPPAATAVNVELFGRPFAASIAAAELARASGCILLPVYLPREGDAYSAHVLPPIPYDRTGLRDINARQELTQQIVRAFEPAIQQHLDQWYHFIPIWPGQR